MFIFVIFRKALERIFDISDLDGNNLLSREEFNWFNIRTSGEEVEDDEWEVVEGGLLAWLPYYHIGIVLYW